MTIYWVFNKNDMVHFPGDSREKKHGPLGTQEWISPEFIVRAVHAFQNWPYYIAFSLFEIWTMMSVCSTVILPPFQIISHSNFLGESKHLKFDQNYIEKTTKICDIK